MDRCKKILIVEDNNDIREVMEEALSTEGFVVDSARNGKEALALLKTTDEPTLIFLDLMMPIMNGWEFLDAMKADAKFAKHKVVTVSAVNATESVEDPTPLKTAGKIQKPMSLETLWAEVKKHCVLPSAAAI